MARKRLTALGAYIFAGGFTVGVKKHFNVIGHLEGDMYGVRTASENFPRLDIRVDPANWHPEEYEGKVDFLYGNPPCAAWSALNGKKTKAELSWQQDPRVDCTRRHFSLIDIIKPTVWTWESVDRAYSTGRMFVDDLTAKAMEMGYSVTHLLVDGQYIGLPHRRKRFFMIVHNVELNFPAPDFSGAPNAGEVLKQLGRLTRKPKKDDVYGIRDLHYDAYAECKPGESMQGAWDRINPPSKRKIITLSSGKTRIFGRPPFKNVKLNPDKVCPTVVGCNIVHPVQPRHLSTEEMKALCGYPPDFKLEDIGGGRPDLLTRAVMPPVGAWLAKHVAASIRKNVKIRKPTLTRVDYRKEPGAVIDLLAEPDGRDEPKAKVIHVKVGKRPKRKSSRLSVDQLKTLADTLPKRKAPKPEDGEGSGAFIRRVLMMNLGYSDEEIAALVHRHYENRTTNVGDVNYNRKALESAGAKRVPERVTKDHSGVTA